ncbi:MAG TPA: AAA family ATPase [Gammaproteobacteria bacterium]|nr:AAA family ATPase [Gammaproteobacteria bacterium]
MSNPLEALQELRRSLNSAVLGQTLLVDRLLIALLADGHLLVEGAPGLAKTRSVRALSEHIEADFQRIQFTPDLLPADLTGTDIYRPQDGSFQFQPGPLFHNLVLADEINRAPAKVQAALLEAMAERQITVGRTTYPLPDIFLVMATQNPLEHEGTYPLPEAQLDRFLMHVHVDYPDLDTERAILKLARVEALAQAEGRLPSYVRMSRDCIRTLRGQALRMHMAEAVSDYLLELVVATRKAAPYHAEVGEAVLFGASPRASLALDRSARAHALLCGRDYVEPGDVQAVAVDVLRHRLLVSYEAAASGMNGARCVSLLLERVAAP